LYDVIDIFLGFMCVRLHKSFENVFLVMWYDEGVEGAFVPLDITDARNGKLDPELLAEAEAEYDRTRNEIFFISEFALTRVLLFWNLLDVLLLDHVALFIDRQVDNVVSIALLVFDHLLFGFRLLLLIVKLSRVIFALLI